MSGVLESVTEPLKRLGMAAYNDPGPISGYEEDHLVAIEAGGSPSDPRNLWPEPGPCCDEPVTIDESQVDVDVAVHVADQGAMAVGQHQAQELGRR